MKRIEINDTDTGARKEVRIESAEREILATVAIRSLSGAAIRPTKHSAGSYARRRASGSILRTGARFREARPDRRRIPWPRRPPGQIPPSQRLSREARADRRSQ